MRKTSRIGSAGAASISLRRRRARSRRTVTGCPSRRAASVRLPSASIAPKGWPMRSASSRARVAKSAMRALRSMLPAASEKRSRTFTFSSSGSDAGMFSIARRQSSNASRWDDRFIACLAASRAVRYASSVMPARSKCIDAWVSEAPSSTPPNSAARAWNRRRSPAGTDRYSASRSSWWRKSYWPLLMDGIQHVVVDELLDRVVERIDRQVHHAGEDARDERPADDGASPRHGLGLGRQPADPRQRRVLEGLRHRRVQDGPAVREPLSADRAAQLLDMERDAVGPGVHGVDHVARRGQAGPEDQGRHQRRLVAGQAAQADLLGEPLRDESRAPLPKHDPGEGLVAPVGPDEQQRPVTRLASHLGQGLQAEVVGPLEVLERQHRRHIRREEIHDLHDQVTPVRDGRGQARPEDVEELAPGRPERGIAAHRPAQVEERGGEDVAVLRSQLGLRDTEPAPGGQAADGTEEPGLPDAGLTRGQEEVAAPAADLVEPPLGEVHEIVTTDDHGREQRPDLRHARSLWHARPASIGRVTDAPCPT